MSSARQAVFRLLCVLVDCAGLWQAWPSLSTVRDGVRATALRIWAGGLLGASPASWELVSSPKLAKPFCHTRLLLDQIKVNRQAAWSVS
jgi:hypothetical protein